MFTYEYERPAYTADIILWRMGDTDIEVLLIERGGEPFKGSFALPGGFVEPGERAVEACIREAQEEIGVSLEERDLLPLSVYDKLGRDPRGWVVSVPFFVIEPFNGDVNAGSDAASYRWVSLRDVATANLAFDHKEMIHDFIRVMASV